MSNIEKNNKSSKASKKKVEEVSVEEVPAEVTNNSENLDKKTTENKMLWIAVAILGSILSVILIVSGFQALYNAMKHNMYNNSGQLEQVYLKGYQDGNNKGYEEGYNQGYSDASMTVQPPMYEPNCDYDYMLKYGYQEGCAYLPENETIQPDSNSQIMPKNRMDIQSSPNSNSW